jgi:hypothetical protein
MNSSDFHESAVWRREAWEKIDSTNRVNGQQSKDKRTWKNQKPMPKTGKRL